MKQSAGILLFRRSGAGVEVLLVHPGGPFWVHRDDRAWSIPKGEAGPDEDLLAAAVREFTEETGFAATGKAMDLGLCKSGKKIVRAWAVEGDADPAALRSNTFTLEWPPRSGTVRSFPEVDRAQWFDLATARRKIHPAQLPLLEALEEVLAHIPR